MEKTGILEKRSLKGINAMKRSLIPLCLCMIVSSGFAAERMDTNFAAGGSIVSPGASTAVFTNPAGLVGNRNVRLSLQGGSPDPMKDPTYRGLLLAGNGMFGAAAGVDYFKPDAGDDQGWAVYGLGIDIASIGVSLGISGYTGIKTVEGTNFNAGLLIRPTQFVSLGATAMNLKDGANSYGVGVGIELLRGIDLIADAAFDDEFKNGEIKPALKLSNAFAGIAFSYGTGDTDQFAKDFGAGAYLRIGANSELEFQYNHGGDLPDYYAALSFGF